MRPWTGCSEKLWPPHSWKCPWPGLEHPGILKNALSMARGEMRWSLRPLWTQPIPGFCDSVTDIIICVTGDRALLCTDGMGAGDWTRCSGQEPAWTLTTQAHIYPFAASSVPPTSKYWASYGKKPKKDNTGTWNCSWDSPCADSELNPDSHRGSDVFHVFSSNTQISQGHKSGAVFTHLPPSIQMAQTK